MGEAAKLFGILDSQTKVVELVRSFCLLSENLREHKYLLLSLQTSPPFSKKKVNFPEDREGWILSLRSYRSTKGYGTLPLWSLPKKHLQASSVARVTWRSPQRASSGKIATSHDRGPPKGSWGREMGPLILGKSRLVKCYDLARWIMNMMNAHSGKDGNGKSQSSMSTSLTNHFRLPC